MSGETVTVVRRPNARAITVAVGAATAAMMLAGCGGGSTPSSGTNSVGGSNPEGGGTGGTGASTTSFDVVSGKVIAASATSATVQATTGPSTVAFSSSTRFTKASSAVRSSLAKGDCVTVTSTRAATGGSGTGAAADGTATPPTHVTARSVTVTSTSACSQLRTQATPGGGFNGTPPAGSSPRFNGEVPGGRGFGGGGAPPQFSGGGGAPQPEATGSPGAGGSFSGGPGRVLRGRFGGGVFGTITAINGSSFTVKPNFAQAGTTTVKTTADTTYEQVATASATDVTKGECLSAAGSTDVSGVLDARSASISQPVKGKCSAATPSFGGPQFFSRGGPGTPPGAGSA